MGVTGEAANRPGILPILDFSDPLDTMEILATFGVSHMFLLGFS